MADPRDTAFMRHALALARRTLGATSPNPAVGALVVRDGMVLAQGWTARGGRPHAEPQALEQAGARARGATLYVTLEPCAHQGQTPPCTQAIMDAGIARVVVGCGDPDARVNGAGIRGLREAGIEVVEGICAAEARAVNEGFFSVIERGRPFVTLKLATSLDGAMAHPAQRWLTGEAARAHGHGLRATHDAILTGIGTALADDPQLTCRLPGLENRSPQRIVLDRQGRLPAASRLHPAWVERDCDDLGALIARLAQRGVTRLLVEAGPPLGAAFWGAGLVDRLYWYRAPLIIPSPCKGEGQGGGPFLSTNERMGRDSHPALPLAGGGSNAIAALRFARRDTIVLGEDMLEIYEPCSPD